MSKLLKKTIVITRIKEESEILAQEFQQKGFETLIEPLFSLQKIDFVKPKKNFLAILITSANACDSLLECDFDKDVKIFAVGKKTAQKLVNAGYKNILIPKKENAKNLKELVLLDLQGLKGDLIYFCGEKIYLDFASELVSFGFVVEKIVCYKMQEIVDFSANFTEKFLQKKLDFVAIYSQNSGVVFLALLAKILEKNNLRNFDKKLKLLCFSEAIANSCLAFKNELKLDFVEAMGFNFCSLVTLTPTLSLQGEGV